MVEYFVHNKQIEVKYLLFCVTFSSSVYGSFTDSVLRLDPDVRGLRYTKGIRRYVFGCPPRSDEYGNRVDTYGRTVHGI